MKKKLLNRGKRKVLKRIFSAMLVMVLMSTGMFTDVNAGRRGIGFTGVSDNSLSPATPAQDDASLYFEPINGDNALPASGRALRYLAESRGTDIFDNTTITLNKLTLKASYQDDSGKSHTVELTQNGNFELPYNADINMRLDFMLGIPSAVEPGRPYTYKLPEGIRVDVEATHDLADNDGKSIGTVHISRDGTLTFIFEKLEDNPTNRNIPFYVQFEGGLSEENQEAGKHIDVKFPTASGDFDFSIDTTGKTGVEEKPEAGPVIMEKSGSRVISENGRNYIEWTISLGANGRDYITGTIHDNLPTGLTYAAIPGYPKVSGLSWGNGGYVETNAKDGDTSIDINVVDCKPDWRANVTFCTYYDEAAFGNINAGTSQLINNKAYFEPEDNTEWSEDDGEVTIRPDVLSKSGSKVDANGNINWTVVINKEKLNLKNVTYHDIFGNGQELVGGSSAIKISPALPSGSTLNTTANGFNIQFSGSVDDTKTYTITYTTHVTDLAQQSFKNTGNLTGGDNVTYDVTQEATVPGLTLIQKNCKDYNSITNRFTWQIIVNPENVEMNNVVVTDTFDATTMKYVSASVTPATVSDGRLTFNLGNINKRQVIEIVTEIINPESYGENNWTGFKNHSEMVSSLNPTTPVNADAERYVQVKKPELIYKNGQIKDNGTVEWVITVLEPQLAVESLTLTDIIPAGMEYIPGSFRLQNMYYDASPVYREPVIGTSGGRQTISYTLSNAPEESRFYKNAFQVYYSTKVPDLDEANESKKYTNHAEISVDYEGNINIKDDAESSVEGVVGGVVNKTYSYKWGTRDVEWTVTINEARNDMSNIQNPKIYDNLADYFDYAGGKLYKLDAKGNRTEVLGSQYVVTVVNGKIIVQLPNIGSDCYQFVFTTRFNCLAQELEGKRITNTVVFDGDGKSFEKESGNVDNVNFSSSSAGAVTRREIRVKKVDSVTGKPLEGARFELRLNGETIGEATSGENGYAVFESYNNLLGYELHLYELQAPDGYTILEQEKIITDYDAEHLMTDENGIQYYEIEVPNVNKDRQNTGDMHIKKVNEYGDILPGAEIGLYADVACTTLLDTRITNDSGTAAFSGYTEGTYYLKEITPPPGYKLPVSNGVVTVVIDRDPVDNNNIRVTYNGSSVDVFEMENTHALGSLRIKKVVKGSTTGISGASFSIYNDINCTDRVAYGTTDSSGFLTLSGLELGRTYYYRETAAPGNYVLDNTIHAITVGKGTETEDQIKDITVENEPARGNIVITKTDNSMPAQTLSGVSFMLYAENGTTVVQGPVTTDSQGVAVFTDVPFGNYVIKETTGKTGYAVASDKNVTVNVIGDVEVTMVNKVIKCDIRILKVESGSTSTKLSGARFGLYTQSGKQVASGVTNADGEVVFHDIPYGDYVLKELEAPEGYKDAAGTWTITGANIENAFNGSGVYSYTIDNEKENGSIRLVKNGEKEGEDHKGEFDPLAGALFTLFDENMLPVATATSQSNGYVEFTQLRYGTYYIQETKAPDGFVRDTGIYKVIVDSDTMQTQYVTDTGKANLVVNNNRSNAPYISVKLKKVDSESGRPVANATFVMYATENGKSTAIGSAVTGSDGIAYFKRIHVEKDDDNTIYTIKETSSPAGYYDPDAQNEIVLGDGRVEINKYADPLVDGRPNLTDDEILWVGGSNPTGDQIVENVPIKGRILITKTAIAEGNPPLAGVQYTLYQEINGKKEKVNITGVTNPVTTNKDGWAVFDDLPCGIYYVKETGVPKGYTLSEEETRFVIIDDSTKEVAYKDMPIEVWVSKQAVDGSAEIQGAVFKIVAKDNPDKVIDSWTSNDRRPHSVLPGVLEIGKTYILSEMIAPDGYGYMPDAEFTVNSDGSITVNGNAEKNGQTVVMRDKPINLAISKQAVEVPGTELANAIMAILDEDGKEIHRFTTNGIAPYEVPLGILTAPKTGYNVYTLREISAPDTYALADDIKFSVGADGTVYEGTGTDKPLSSGILTMLDAKKEPFYLRKLDAGTRLDVPGAKFDIYDEDGNAVSFGGYSTSGRPLKVDTLGSGIYIIRELEAPDGYLTAREVKFKLTFNSDGTYDIEILDGRATNLNADKDTFMIYDTPIELKIRKQDSFGMILNGATLKLSKYNRDTQTIGEEIVTFTSDGQKSYTVLPSDLECDADYILQELDAPDGYMRAEDIILHIADNGVITRDDGVKVVNNTIVMEDDEAGLGIGKFSLDDGDGLAGCTLMLETLDDPWWETITWVSDGHVRTWDLLEFTPGCTYILTELEAPVGYAYADPITFTINADDHQIYIDGEKVENRTVKISDGKIKLTVSKQDFYDHVEVPGAELSILDKEGNVLASWVSGSEPCAVDTSKLIAGNESYEEYILREVTAPNGYYKTVDIPFAIDRDGNIYLVQGNGQYTKVEDNKIIMYDEPMLTIAKLDTSGNPVVGATLTITAKDDPNFAPISWETTEERRSFEDGTFAPGATYILTETEAPNGYGYGQSIEFMVNADNQVFVNGQLVENRRIVMLDYPIKVLVSKLDGGNRQPLAGAKLVIKNEAGEVIHTFTSTGEPILIPKEIFKAVQGGMSYYTLSEIEAPGGYQIAPDIAFAIDSSGNLLQRNEDGTYVRCEDGTLVMLDYAGDSGYSTNPNINTNVPRTGDSTPLGMLIALCVAGFIGACAIFGWYFIRRRKKTES